MGMVVATTCHHGVESTTILVLFQVRSVAHVEGERVKIVFESIFVNESSDACINKLS